MIHLMAWQGEYGDIGRVFGPALGGSLVILGLVFWYLKKNAPRDTENDRMDRIEDRAEERGEITQRLKNLEVMKDIVDKNQGLIMELARDNQKLTSIFLQEFKHLERRVAILESRL